MKTPDQSYLDLAIETLTIQGEGMINRYFSKECEHPYFTSLLTTNANA